MSDVHRHLNNHNDSPDRRSKDPYYHHHDDGRGSPNYYGGSNRSPRERKHYNDYDSRSWRDRDSDFHSETKRRRYEDDYDTRSYSGRYSDRDNKYSSSSKSYREIDGLCESVNSNSSERNLNWTGWNREHFLDGSLKTLKQFIDELDRYGHIPPGEGIREYEKYKNEFRQKHLKLFFEAHKSEDWFKERYDPTIVYNSYNPRLEIAKKEAQSFFKILEDPNDPIHSFSLNADEYHLIFERNKKFYDSNSKASGTEDIDDSGDESEDDKRDEFSNSDSKKILESNESVEIKKNLNSLEGRNNELIDDNNNNNNNNLDNINNDNNNNNLDNNINNIINNNNNNLNEQKSVSESIQEKNDKISTFDDDNNNNNNNNSELNIKSLNHFTTEINNENIFLKNCEKNSVFNNNNNNNANHLGHSPNYLYFMSLLKNTSGPDAVNENTLFVKNIPSKVSRNELKRHILLYLLSTKGSEIFPSSTNNNTGINEKKTECEDHHSLQQNQEKENKNDIANKNNSLNIGNISSNSALNSNNDNNLDSTTNNNNNNNLDNNNNNNNLDNNNLDNNNNNNLDNNNNNNLDNNNNNNNNNNLDNNNNNNNLDDNNNNNALKNENNNNTLNNDKIQHPELEINTTKDCSKSDNLGSSNETLNSTLQSISSAPLEQSKETSTFHSDNLDEEQKLKFIEDTCLDSIILSEVNLLKDFSRMGWIRFTSSEIAQHVKNFAIKLSSGEELHFGTHHSRATSRKPKLTPDIWENSSIVEKFLNYAKQLILKLDNEKGIENNVLFSSNNNCDNHHLLDLMIFYLRRVHWFNFFSGEEFFIFDQFLMRAGDLYLRGTRYYNSKTDSNWIKTLETKFNDRLTQSNPYFTWTGIPQLEEIEKKFWDSDILKEVDRCRCALCPKAFRDENFTKNHILRNHPKEVEKLEIIKNQLKKQIYFNNYINDPRKIVPQILATLNKDSSLQSGKKESRSQRRRKNRSNSENNGSSSTSSNNNINNNNNNNNNNNKKQNNNNNNNNSGNHNNSLRNGGGIRRIINYVDLDAPKQIASVTDYSKTLQAFKEQILGKKLA